MSTTRNAPSTRALGQANIENYDVVILGVVRAKPRPFQLCIAMRVNREPHFRVSCRQAEHDPVRIFAPGGGQAFT